jgi:hypothetical protein
MGRASQLHKLDTRGYNSIGGRKALAKYLSDWGTDTNEVVIELNGLWGTGDTITATLNIGAGDLTPNYTPAGDEDAVAAASGFATQIAAQTDVSATSESNIIRVTKTTAGTIELKSLVIS